MDTKLTLAMMERRMAVIMRIGVFIAMATMLIGLVLFFIHPGVIQPENMGQIWQGILAGDGVSWMMLGLLFLILTPVLRVVSSIFYFMRARDITYVIITSLVLIILIIGMFYGASH